MIRYLLKNLIPLLLEILLILDSFLSPDGVHLYSAFGFFALLFSWFHIRGEFSFRQWFGRMKSGFRFWGRVLLTSMLFAGALLLTGFLRSQFPELDPGTVRMQVGSISDLLIFACTTVFLPPVAEELFFRQSLICTDSRKAAALTLPLSVLLYGLSRAVTPWGMGLAMIGGIPLYLSYFRTEDVYVPMTAHLIVNIFGNGYTVIVLLLRMIGLHSGVTAL